MIKKAKEDKDDPKKDDPKKREDKEDAKKEKDREEIVPKKSPDTFDDLINEKKSSRSNSRSKAGSSNVSGHTSPIRSRCSDSGDRGSSVSPPISGSWALGMLPGSRLSELPTTVSAGEIQATVSEEDRRPKSARQDKLLLKGTSPRRLKSARGDPYKKRFFRHKDMRDIKVEMEEGCGDKKFIRATSASTVPSKMLKAEPPLPLSPVKTRKWTLMTIDKAIELGIEPLEFLGELHDLLSDDKEAQIKFLEVDGFNKLMSHLLTSEVNVAKKIVEIIGDSIQEKEIFTKLFLDFGETLIRISHLLLKYPNDSSVKTLVYQLLSSLVEVPQSLEIAGFDGQATILCSLNYYKSKSTEQRRFEHLVAGLRLEVSPEKQEKLTEDYEDSALAIFKLINALIDGNEKLESRIAMRNEFAALGLNALVESLLETDKYKDSMLVYHLQAFKMSREVDNNQLQSQDSKYFMEKSEAAHVTEEIMKRYEKHTHIQNLFVNILQSMVKLQIDNTNGLPLWLLLDKLMNEICTEKNNLPLMMNEGKIKLEKGLDLERLFAARDNEAKLKKELADNVEEHNQQSTTLKQKVEEMELAICKKKDKIHFLKNELEDEIDLIQEYVGYFDEYDSMLDEYENKLQKIEDENLKIKNLLEQNYMLLENNTPELDESNKAIHASKKEKDLENYRKSIADDLSNIPKWKLQQQLMAKQMQERREQERSAKMEKINSIRKRIKEIGHDAVSQNTVVEDEENGAMASPLPVVAISEAGGTTPTPATGANAVAGKEQPQFHHARQKFMSMSRFRNSAPRLLSTSGGRTSDMELEHIPGSPSVRQTPTLTLNIQPPLPEKPPPTPREEELAVKLEKVKSKKKKQAALLEKKEKESQQLKMQLLALEKEKEARQREDQKLRIKMQRTEEEKENVQRQRQTLQEEMKKLAQQRERMTQELRKEKEKITKTKQEIEKMKQSLEDEKVTWAKQHESMKKEHEEKMEQLKMERELFDEELMQAYMEEKDMEKEKDLEKEKELEREKQIEKEMEKELEKEMEKQKSMEHEMTKEIEKLT